MSKTMRTWILAAALALASVPALGWAQPVKVADSLMTGVLELNLGNLEKPDIQTPGVSNPVDTKGIQYEEKEIKVETEYKPLEVKPPQPPKVEMPPLLNNLVSLGYGRFASPYAKLYLNTGRNLDANVGLDFTHVSSSKGYVDYAEFRDDEGGIKGEYYANGHTLRGAVRVHNTNYFYFADTIAEGHPDWKDSLRETFTRLDIETALARKTSPNDINYDVGLRFNGFFDKHRAVEKGRDLHVGLLPTINWKITDQFFAGIASNFTFSNSSFDTVAQTRFFLDLTPTVTFKLEGLEVMGGLKVNSLADSNTHFAAFPLLTARYQVVPNKFAVAAGLTGEMHYLRYYDLIVQNRYLDRNLDIRPMRDRAHIYVGVEGQLAKYLAYSVRFYTRKIKDQLIFFNPEGGSEFQMLYDSNFTQTGVKAGISFNKDNKIRAGIDGDFRTFRTSNIAYNFNTPGVRMDFWASYNFADKVLVGTELYLYGGRVMSMDTLGRPIEHGITADVNLSAEYRFSQRISIFLQMNNLLGNNWQRWYGYRERPFDVKGGVTFAF